MDQEGTKTCLIFTHALFSAQYTGRIILNRSVDINASMHHRCLLKSAFLELVNCHGLLEFFISCSGLPV